ncbi:hypothetical protein ACP70R_039386 [Stipagrostis hirtigluma subsp. patula]
MMDGGHNSSASKQSSNNRRPASTTSRLGRAMQDCVPITLEEHSPAAHEQATPDLRSSCRVSNVARIFGGLDGVKRELVKEIGFDGLLKLPGQFELDETLSLWLLSRLDTDSCSLITPRGEMLPIRDVDVHFVLGIPFHGTEVRHDNKVHGEVLAAIKRKLSITGTAATLTMDYLEHLLMKDYAEPMQKEEKDAFKIAAVLYAMANLLAVDGPKNRFPLSLLRNFLDTNTIGQINWSGYVLSIIREAAVHVKRLIEEGKEIHTLGGCTYFLQVMYIDNLSLGSQTTAHLTLPRCCAYKPETLKMLILLDMKKDASGKPVGFGVHKLRPSEEVCYSRGWGISFAQQQVNAASLHEDTLDLLRSAMQFAEDFWKKLGESMSRLNQTAACDLRNKYQHMYPWYKPSAPQILPDRNRALGVMNLRASTIVKNARAHQTLKRCPIPCKPPTSKMPRIAQDPSPHIVEEVESSSWDSSTNGTSESCAFSNTTVEQSSPSSSECSSDPGNTDPNTFRSESHDVPSHTSSESDPRYQSSVDGPVKIVHEHSMFGESPFDTNNLVVGINRLRQMAIFKWLEKGYDMEDQLGSVWFRHDEPSTIEIYGHTMKAQLSRSGSFDVVMCEAIMRMSTLHDDSLAEYAGGPRWRHFLTPKFGEYVLKGQDILGSTEIRNHFIGKHLKYDVENCRMIILPVRYQGKWSCYFWDFLMKRIVILDPTMMNMPWERVELQHAGVIDDIHSALMASIKRFFKGWVVDPWNWPRKFVTNLGPTCKHCNSGLYASHYARFFNGNKLKFQVGEGDLGEARATLLYQLLKMEGNCGQLPPRLALLTQNPGNQSALIRSIRNMGG